jgi:hypothetical protein
MQDVHIVLVRCSRAGQYVDGAATSSTSAHCKKTETFYSKVNTHVYTTQKESIGLSSQVLVHQQLSLTFCPDIAEWAPTTALRHDES